MKSPFKIGEKCNNRCKICNYKAKEDKDIKQILKEIKSFNPAEEIILSGGEICIRKDFFALLKILSAKGFKNVKIMSNGKIFSYPDFLNRIFALGINKFCIKLSAVTEGKYYQICGDEKGLSKVIVGLENLKKNRETDLEILIQVCSENFNDLLDIVLAVSTLQIDKIIFDFHSFKIKDNAKSKILEILDICKANSIETEIININLTIKKPKLKKIKLKTPKIYVEVKPDTSKSIDTGADPRIMPAKDTVERAKKVIKHTTFKNISPIFGSNEGMYLYLFNKTKPETYWGSTKAQFGKGLDKNQALASGYMETIERFCATPQTGDEKEIIYAKYDDIAEYALDPKLLYITQGDPFFNKKGSKMIDSYLPSYLDNAWVWAYSVFNKKPILVPAALAYKGFVSKNNRFFIHSHGLGLGAGNSIAEAIIHGINEWMESDALNSLPIPIKFSELNNLEVIDPNSIPNLPDTIKRISDAIFFFYIKSKNYNFNTHVILPTIFFKNKNDNIQIVSGVGCNLNPQNAFNRGLTECIEICFRNYQNVFEKNKNILYKSKKYIPKKLINFSDLQDYSSKTIYGDYLKYLEMLKNNDLDLIVRDFTRSEFNTPVFRVIIPKLGMTLSKDNLHFDMDDFSSFKNL